jgi:hypothetical protein
MHSVELPTTVLSSTLVFLEMIAVSALDQHGACLAFA